MDPNRIGETYIERGLELDGGDTVMVVVGKSYPHPEGDFACAWQVRGLSDGRFDRPTGVDAVQSLWLALQMIGAYLYTSAEGRARRLTWLGEADLGFPVTKGLEDLLP